MADRPVIRSSRDLAPYIDHTLLRPDATREDLVRLCEEARSYGFATVCVTAANVPLCARVLEGSRTRPIAVVGFPSGTASTQAKVAEAQEAIRAGAAELDMVVHTGRLQAKDYAYVEADIRAVVAAAAPRPVKVILETGALSRDEKVVGCALAKAAGAAFVKTSTGFGPGGATVEDVVRTAADARRMLQAGANRLGTSASVAIVTGE